MKQYSQRDPEVQSRQVRRGSKACRPGGYCTGRSLLHATFASTYVLEVLQIGTCRVFSIFSLVLSLMSV
jgi:hypothetical protein